MYTCVKKAQARAGFEMDSDKTAVIAVGTQIEVTADASRLSRQPFLSLFYFSCGTQEGMARSCMLPPTPLAARPGWQVTEEKANDKGAMRLKFDGGWVSCAFFLALCWRATGGGTKGHGSCQ